MIELVKGGNCAIDAASCEIVLKWRSAHPAIDQIDVSAFLLRAARKVSGDGDMVFYGQRQSGDRSIAIRSLDQTQGDTNPIIETRFVADLAAISQDVTAIAFTATLSDGVAQGCNFSRVDHLEIAVWNDDKQIASFLPSLADAEETALNCGELYRRNGQWKFRAVGQGYRGGLKQLAESFGVKIADDRESYRKTETTPAHPPSSSPPVSSVRLSKVTLNKTNPTVDLTKKDGSFGEIKINLNWSRRAVKSGFFQTSRELDLDLGCLYELHDGEVGGVQALGGNFGNLDREPFIRLSADDRTGASADGEWLHVNGHQWEKIRRVLIYTFIYEGAANWAETDGRITMSVPGHPPIEVNLDESSKERVCAIALIENDGGAMKVTRLVQYFKGQSYMDHAHRWGLRWRAGGAKD